MASKSRNGSAIGYIEPIRPSLTALSPNLGSGSLGSLRVDIGCNDPGSMRSQTTCNRSAVTLPGTGDDRETLVQQHETPSTWQYRGPAVGAAGFDALTTKRRMSNI